MGNTKMKRSWDNFFSYIKTIKAAKIITVNRTFSIEKLNLTWNKWPKFNKLCTLPLRSKKYEKKLPIYLSFPVVGKNFRSPRQNRKKLSTPVFLGEERISWIAFQMFMKFVPNIPLIDFFRCTVENLWLFVASEDPFSPN